MIKRRRTNLKKRLKIHEPKKKDIEIIIFQIILIEKLLEIIRKSWKLKT